MTKLERAVKLWLHAGGWFLITLFSSIAFVGWWEIIT